MACGVQRLYAAAASDLITTLRKSFPAFARYWRRSTRRLQRGVICHLARGRRCRLLIAPSISAHALTVSCAHVRALCAVTLARARAQYSRRGSIRCRRRNRSSPTAGEQRSHRRRYRAARVSARAAVRRARTGGRAKRRCRLSTSAQYACIVGVRVAALTRCVSQLRDLSKLMGLDETTDLAAIKDRGARASVVCVCVSVCNRSPQ
jgi:hypothetical protein